MHQKTLKQSVQCQGVGLHSGKRVTLQLCPAEPDTGIVFRRTDITDCDNTIPALYSNVVDTKLCTKIANKEGVSVGTVEHLMSALRASHLSNVVIKLDGPEVPIMDGSAEPFFFMIDCAGTLVQEARQKVVKVLKPVTVTEDDKQASLEPSDTPSFEFDIDFAHNAIGQQNRTLRLVNGNFRLDIARARTFGFLQEVEALKGMGLIQGGSLDNAIVLDDEKIMNKSGLRYRDEFVRHKILDAVGDLFLSGQPIVAAYRGHKSGHDMHHKLLQALFADKSNYRIATL